MSSLDLKTLYEQKGELTMNIQVNQARLQAVDKQIIDILNKSPKHVDSEVVS